MYFSTVTSATELRELYPLIEEGVKAIDGKTSKPPRRIAPDVYKSVSQGDLVLVIMHDEDRVWGWATIKIVNEPTSVSGFCEDFYLTEKAPSTTIPEFLDYWEKVSRADGATRMLFTTQRKGWLRRLEKHGYHLAGYIVEKELI